MIRSRKTPDFLAALQMAEQRLRAHGHRVTRARQHVLATLIAGDSATTQDDLSRALEASRQGVDRVTVYRVLEWLVENRLAHRVANDSRAWQFNALRDNEHEHGHFACRECERVFCLDEPELSVAVQVPDGFRAETSELLIRGQCPECSKPGRRGKSKSS